MPRLKKTFSFNVASLKLLDMLCSEKNISNQSELLRILIAEEAVRYGLINSTDLSEFRPAENKDNRSELLHSISNIETMLSKMQLRLGDIETMTYQTRDGMNSYLNFVDLDAGSYSSAEPDSQRLNPIIKRAEDTYNTKKRQLAINKANFGRK